MMKDDVKTIKNIKHLSTFLDLKVEDKIELSANDDISKDQEENTRIEECNKHLTDSYEV